MAVRTDRVTPNQVSPGVILVPEKANIWQESSTALVSVGTRLKLNDGRTFYYAKCGPTAVPEPGRVIVAKELTDTEEDTNLAAAETIGSREISILAAAQTGVSYVGGYFVVIAGTGAGQTHKIRDITTTAAAGTATVYLYDELVTALDTTSDTVCYPNPFWNVGEETTNGRQVQILGVSPIAVTAGYYFWLQTWGWASAMSGDSLGNAANERECITTTTGSSVISTAGGVAGAQILGFRVYDSADAVSGEWELTYLRCVP